ncbi:MAG: WD40/YVTN/BNR-like repeat-containing protein [Gemmatimonadaceae bacterium]
MPRSPFHSPRGVSWWCGALAACTLAASPVSAQRATLDSATLAGFRWRTIGPANFEGRVADVVGIPSPSQTFFVAAAAGGIWKTSNGGVTFRPVFDDQRVISMGALAIAPSDTQQVWAGTGEQNSRNTIEPGRGVFKSTDGGVSWHPMGLEKTQHIGRIVVHPTNPNVVYVAALGAAWTTNPERGLYKTEDGGQTWRLVKFVSDRAGFVDVALDPKDPNIVWAASYERMRGPYFLNSGGPGSALWKSTDAGATWTEIRGGGFPETPKGRISLAVYPQDPAIVYAMVEADSVRGRPVAKGMPRQPRQKLANGLYRTRDGGRTWEKMNDANTRPFYYSQVRVHPRNPDRVWFSSTPVLVSSDGGKTARTATQGIHVDHHAMWIDPSQPDHFIVGDDGGISITWDGGGSYDFPANLPIGQFYDVSFDFETPYNVCSGAQDNGSWCGPSRRKNGPVTNAYWSTIAGGDGFYTAQHPTEPWVVFGESQGGNISRLNLRTGERAALVKPAWRPRYQQFEDSVLVTRGDSARAETREQRDRIAALRARQRADSAQFDVRFNWETPFFISSHNPDVMYVGGNRVLKSTRRGDSLYFISADLSRQQRAKIDTSMNKTGGITLDATGAETYGTVVSLAESYVRPGFLYAGTDDGNVWTTTTDGAAWEQIPAARFPGLPRGDVYVSRIEPSHFDTLSFYVAFDNHRWNDFTPYLYATTDGGRTFRSIAAGLPTGSADQVHVIREDPASRDLLYVGTSLGAYVSLDHGASWQRFMTGMPTVPVYDLKIHPRDRELIAATHGRGLWIVDVTPLQQMAGSALAAVAAAPVHLFTSKTGYEYGQGPAVGESANGSGHKVFAAASPPYGAEIVYHIAAGAAPAAAVATRNGAPPDTTVATTSLATTGATEGSDNGGGTGSGRRRGGQGAQGGQGAPRGPQASILITNARGDTVRTLTGPATAGLHRVVWDFRGRPVPRAPLSPSQRRDSVERAQRASFVIDSLEKAGTSRPVTETLRRLASGSVDAAGLFRGGARGSGGTGGAWVARPGEGAFVGAGGAREQGEGASAAGGEQSPIEALNAFPGGTEALTELFQIPGRPPERGGLGTVFGGGGGGRGRNAAPVVASGDYLVTLTVGGRTYKQLLRVERLSGGDDSGSAFGEDEEDWWDP